MEVIKCCFIGHREIKATNILRENIRKTVENIILESVHINEIRFLFGSRSQFNDLCYEIISELRVLYPYIKRINCPTKNEYTVIDGDNRFDNYSKIKRFEAEIRDEKILISSRASYIIRNRVIIDNSDICIFYYSPDYVPLITGRSKSRKSGTALAYEYAKNNKKKIINLFSDEN